MERRRKRRESRKRRRALGAGVRPDTLPDT